MLLLARQNAVASVTLLLVLLESGSNHSYTTTQIRRVVIIPVNNRRWLLPM
jgi:hypothetical protein